MILTEPKIIVPNQHLAKVYHQMGLGVHAYEEDSLWTPDSDLWESCVLNMRLSDYPPNLTYAWDRSRYQNHGTITGTAYGRQGRSFDGVDDYIRVPSAASLNLTNRTEEQWIVFGGATWYNTLLNKRTQADGTMGFWRSYIGSAKDLFWKYADGAALQLLTWDMGVGFFKASTAYHIAFTKIGDSVTAYVDSSQLVTQTATGALNESGNALYIGRYQSTSNPFSGIIGEVRIYNRALTPQEVRHNYLATKWRYR
ncbi:MAG TPA: LamG domain-containing protein [Dehalococcoidia bacterium]